MKKLFIILMAFVAIAVNAQNLQCYSTAGGNGFFPYYYGVAQDTIGVTQDTVAVDFDIIKPMDLFYDVQVKLTEVRGRGYLKTSLQGRIFNTDDWTNIEDRTYWGTGSDTTFNYTQHTTASKYNYFRIYCTKANSLGATKISYVRFSLHDN